MRSCSVFLLVLLAACMQPVPVYDEEALQQWREARAERLVAEDGWTALIGLHWLDSDRAWTLGAAADVDVHIDGLPERFGVLRRVDETWTLHLADDVQADIDQTRVRNSVELISDREAAAQGIAQTRLRSGPVRMALIDRGERQALRVWSADAPGRVGFAGLNWFAPAPDWRIEARWLAHDPPRQIEIVDVTGALQSMTNPGAVMFQREGREFRLEALAEADDPQLFLIFADRSNGRETYGAGRYLYAERPNVQGQVMLDFNRAYNPPCAFSAFATCPLPPPENRLDLPVAAGEKAYVVPRQASESHDP